VSRPLVQLGARSVARIRRGWRRGRYAAAFVTVALAGALADCGDSVPAVGLWPARSGLAPASPSLAPLGRRRQQPEEAMPMVKAPTLEVDRAMPGKGGL